MKNTNFFRVFMLAFMVVAISFSGCKKDEDDDDDDNIDVTEVAEDKENIASSFDDILGGIAALKDGDAVTAIINFTNIQDGEILNEEWIENIIEELDIYIDYDYIEDNLRFNFYNYVGTYTWNFTTETWSKNNSPSDKIILEFPSEKNNSTNNAILTLNSYNDQSVTFDGEQYWLPTSLQMDLKVDNAEILNLTVNNVSYYNGDFSIPTDIDIDLTIVPYNFSIKANRESSTKFHFDVEYDNNGSDNFSFVADVTLAHSDYENIDFEEDITYATGEIKYDNLSFPFECDIESLMAFDDPTESQINSLINVDVFFNSIKIGDLEYQDNSGDIEIFIIYKDGSSENTDRYYKDFLEELEAMLILYTGEWYLDLKKRKKC